MTHEQNLDEDDPEEEQFTISKPVEVKKSAMEQHHSYANLISNDLPLQYYQEK